MIEKKLIAERSITYNSHRPGLAAGDRYNGQVAGSTAATAMAPTVGGDGKAIKIQPACRALVTVSLGDIGSGLLGAVEAWVCSESQKADGSTMTKIPDFGISYADTDDNKTLKGEIDLRGVAPSAYVAGDNALNLYIRHNGTGVNVNINVQLMDFEREAPGEVLVTSYPASLLDN